MGYQYQSLDWKLFWVTDIYLNEIGNENVSYIGSPISISVSLGRLMSIESSPACQCSQLLLSVSRQT